MFNKKALMATTTLGFLCILGVSTANAGDTGCYTLASLEGTYAIVGTYGSNVAIALGIRHDDGKGNFTATFLVNEPRLGSPTGARKLVTGTLVGTYTVNCDGTGVIHKTVTTSSGIAHSADDFVITNAVTNGDQLVATSIEEAQRTPSAIVPGGVFLIRTLTRLPSGD
jgi:hypothetical protein